MDTLIEREQVGSLGKKTRQRLKLLSKLPRKVSDANCVAFGMEDAVLSRTLLAALLLVVTAVGAMAQDHKVQVTTADFIKWGPAPPVLPKGAEMSVLSGDPGKSGTVTIRLKLPPNYKIPAHQHPTHEAVTVISGELHFGMGETLEEAKAQTLSQGGFVDLPADMNHFAFSLGGAVVQIASEGPFAIKYVNQEDDPSKTK